MQLFVELTADRSRCARRARRERGALAAVVHQRRRAVRVDVVHRVGGHAGVGERLLHRLDRPVAVGRRVGDAIAAQRIAVAGQLGVDVRAASARGSHSSSTRKPAPSPSRKPLRVASNGRLARVRRVVVGRERAEQAEPGQPDRVEHRIETAGEHEIGPAAAHHLERRADGLSARGAGGVHRRWRNRGCRKRRPSSARPALVWLRQKAIGSSAGDVVEQPLRIELAVADAVVVHFSSSLNGTPIMPAPTQSPSAPRSRRSDGCRRRGAPPRRPRARRRASGAANLRSLRSSIAAARRNSLLRRRCASRSRWRRTG